MTTIGRSERSERSALLGDVTTTAPVPGLIQAEPATSLCPSRQITHLLIVGLIRQLDRYHA